MKASTITILINLFLISSISEATVPISVPVKNNKDISRFHTAVPIILPHPNGLECDACQFLAKELDDKVFHNEHLIEIAQNELDNICTVLPKDAQDLCLAAVNNTVPGLLGKIGDYVEEQGCTEIGVCKSVKK